jgi:long-chain acyl-CoA synthetase
VQTRPDGVASECDGRIRTWREFAARPAALAGALAGLGYRPGDRIGMLALNCDRYLEYFFAMAWGGFVFVPVNTRLAAPDVAFWLQDSECSALFIDDTFLPMLKGVRAELRDVIRVGDGAAPKGCWPTRT